MIGMTGYDMTHIGNLKKQNDDYFARQARGPNPYFTSDPSYVTDYRDYLANLNNPTRKQIQWQLEADLQLLREKERAALLEGDRNRAHQLQLQREQLEAEFASMGFKAGTDAAMQEAGARNQIIGQAAGYARERDRQRAVAGYEPSQSFFEQLMAGGMTDAEYSAQVARRGEAADEVALVAAHQAAGAAAQRGLGGNPMATMALGLGGRFAASRARGEAAAGLQQDRVRNRMAGAQGYAAGAGALANLWMAPTQEGALDTLQHIQRAAIPATPTVPWASGAVGGQQGTGGGQQYVRPRDRARQPQYGPAYLRR